MTSFKISDEILPFLAALRELIYTPFYCRAPAIASKFGELDKDGSGLLDADEARAGLKNMVMDGGRHLEEAEIDFFLRTTVGENNQIDLGHFASLLYRLKLHKGPKK